MKNWKTTVTGIAGVLVTLAVTIGWLTNEEAATITELFSEALIAVAAFVTSLISIFRANDTNDNPAGP